MQASDHPADQDTPTLQGTNRSLVNRVERTRDAKLRDGLLRGAARIEEELTELRHGSPAARLGYIRTYGEGRAHELIATLELAGSAECASETRGVCGERAGQFMDA